MTTRTDVVEAASLKYRTSGIVHLLKDSRLDMADDFTLYCLAQALPNARAYNAIMVENNGDCAGVEYKQPDNEKYAFVLPDASRPGKWRVSFYDCRGFSYHHVADTSEASTEEMVLLGFTQKASGSLDKLASTREWALGTNFADLLFRLNSRQISHDVFVSLSQELNDKYLLETVKPVQQVLETENEMA